MESICSFSRKKSGKSERHRALIKADFDLIQTKVSLRWGPFFVHWHLWEAHPRSGLKDNFNLECAVTSYCTSSYNESLVRSDTHPRIHSLQFLKYLSCGEGGLLWALRVHTSGCWRWCWGIWDGRERKRERERASSVSRWCTKHVFFCCCCLKWGKSPGWSGHLLNYSEKTWWKILSVFLFRWTVSPTEMLQ